jgi:hypothetical protein
MRAHSLRVPTLPALVSLVLLCVASATIARAQDCSITGPATTCGSAVELCATAGDFEYEWTGPNGFTAQTQCISVSEPGTYSVRLFDFINGLWFAPCSHTLEAADCGGGSKGVNCPRTAHFWFRQCQAAGHRGDRLSAETVAAIAACVDGRMQIFAWNGNPARLTAALAPSCQFVPRSRALRQVAALAANVCASGVEVVSRGDRVGLDPALQVLWEGKSMSVSEWLGVADARLLDLAKQRDGERNRRAYHQLANFARRLNRGLGIGTVCSPKLTAQEQAEDDEND